MSNKDHYFKIIFSSQDKSSLKTKVRKNLKQQINQIINTILDSFRFDTH